MKEKTEFRDNCNSYNYIKSGNNKLIVTFAGIGTETNRPPKFQFVRSLSDMSIDSDFLFMKDSKRRWYLGGIDGIGSEFNDTLSFLRNVIADYDKVIFMGISAGGYASILFGSLLDVDSVVAFIPQTDLDYVMKHSKTSRWQYVKFLFAEELTKLKARKLYNNLRQYINPTTEYHIYTKYHDKDSLHDPHHFYNIKESVKKLFSIDEHAPEFIKSGGLEVLLKKLLG